MKYFFLTLCFLLTATAVFAQGNYQLLVELPLGPQGQIVNETSINTFIPAAIKLIIGIAGGLAVIFIVIGGVQYLSTDAWGKKSDARNTITNAIVGLLLAIGAYAILNTLNPALVDFNLSLDRIQTGSEIGDPDGLDGDGNTTKTAVELGCKENACDPIDSGEITVRPGACTNNPCYAHKAITTYLNSIKNDLLDLNEEDDVFISWQIIKAFPRTGSDDPYYKPNPNADENKAGSRIELAMTNPSIPRIIHFVNRLQRRAGTAFIYYNICPADLLNAAKQSQNPRLDNAAVCKLVCRPNSTQSAMIATQVFEDGTRPPNCQ